MADGVYTVMLFACECQRAVGSNCQVNVSRHHVTFDLSELQKTTGYPWHVNTSQGVFSLNVCGPVSGPSMTGSCSSGLVGACLVHNGTAVNVG